jgi:hypothetical protein
MRFGHEFLLDERMRRTFDPLNISYLCVEGHQGVTLTGALALDVCDKGLQKTKEDSTLEILQILNDISYTRLNVPYNPLADTEHLPLDLNLLSLYSIWQSLPLSRSITTERQL